MKTERIRELAEQCHHRYSEHSIDLEKFAELIVRECVDAIIKQNDDESIDDWDRGYEAGLRSATAVISEHFGVEE